MNVFRELFPDDIFKDSGPDTSVGLVMAICALADEIRALRSDVETVANEIRRIDREMN